LFGGGFRVTEVMTSPERVFAAMERRMPDRTPILENTIDPAVVAALGFDSYAQMYDELPLDAVTLGPLMDYPEGAPLRIPTGKRTTTAWGVTVEYTSEYMPVPVEYPINSPADLDNFAPPDPAFSAVERERITAIVRRYKGRKAILASNREVFGDAWYLRGMVEFLMDLIERPDLVRRMTRMVADYNKERARQLIEMGVEILFMGDDYAYKSGPLMSPRQFHEFFAPGMAEVVQYMKRLGAYTIKHTDGDIWKIIDDIVATGVHCLGPLEPGAAMDLIEVKRRYGDRVCLLGNVDVDLLCRGSAEEVSAETRRLLAALSPGGGYILSSGNSITSAVQPENFLAMIETAASWRGA
jgi:uroporphyrinogen decarboxylase